MYADVHGHIGYQAPGLIPIRRTSNGDWPVPGWDPAYDWDKSTVPFDALPNVLDPKDGYVVTANQAVVDKRYPYYIGDSFDYGFRSQRIRHLLASTPDLTVEDMARIQLDTYSALARRLTPVLEAVRLPSPYYRLAQATLHGWDYRLTANSPAAAYFSVVWKNLLALIFHDQLPQEAWPTGNSRWWMVVENLLKRPHDSFWDNVNTHNVVETRDGILRAALEDARDELTRTRSSVPKNWRWGDLHQLVLRNPTLGSRTSPVAFLFNRGPYDVPGGSSVVDAASFDASKGYDVTSAPSMRMIVPLDDLDAARWVDLTGESGHAYNDHYTDQTELWLAGKTLPWAFSPAAVRSRHDRHADTAAGRRSRPSRLTARGTSVATASRSDAPVGRARHWVRRREPRRRTAGPPSGRQGRVAPAPGRRSHPRGRAGVPRRRPPAPGRSPRRGSEDGVDSETRSRSARRCRTGRHADPPLGRGPSPGRSRAGGGAGAPCTRGRPGW